MQGPARAFKERLAVDGVGFEVAAGETYGLLGPNGAGKNLRQRLRDRSALVIAFVAPFVLASIIGLAPGGGDSAFKATYAVADADLATWCLRRTLIS